VAEFEFWLTCEPVVIHLTKMKTDVALLQAALVGYQSQIAEMEKAMAEIRQKIGALPATHQSSNGGTAKRTLSAAARKRISAAQKKRWAEYNKQKQSS
jgi:hypothetical protein